MLQSLLWAIGPAALAMEPGEIYAQHCAACHGNEGLGDGPVGVMLRPAPAPFADPGFWTEERTEDRLVTVILKGGEAAGLAPTMASWKGVLSRAEARALARWLRETWEPPLETGEPG